MASHNFPQHQPSSTSRRRKSRRRHSSRHSQPQEPLTSANLFHWLTEFFLIGSVLLTLVLFGGRTTSGLLGLNAMAIATAFCWIVRCLLEKQKWHWSGFELPAVLTIAAAGIQLVPLSTEHHQLLVPSLNSFLPAWSQAVHSAESWNQISLVPHETQLALSGVLSAFSLILIASQVYQNAHSRNRAVLALCAIPLLWSVIGMIQIFAGNGKFLWVFAHPFVETGEHTRTSFTNPNHMAGLAAMGLGPAICLYFSKWSLQNTKNSANFSSSSDQQTTKLGLLLLGMIILFTATAWTDSRGGMILLGACGIVTLFLAVLSGSIGRGMLLIPMVILLLGGTIGILGNEKTLEHTASQIASAQTEDLKQASARTEIWQANRDGIEQFYTSGVGLGTHRLTHHPFLKEYFPREYTHAENGYLQFSFELGLTGMVILLLGIVLFLYHAQKCLRHSTSSSDKLIAVAAISVVFCLMFHSLYDYVLYVPALGLMAGFWLAILIALSHSLPVQQTGESNPATFSVPGWNPLFATGMLTALIATIQPLPQAYTAEQHYWNYLASSTQATAIDEFSTPEEQQAQKEAQKQYQLKQLMAAFLANPSQPQYANSLAHRMLTAIRQEISNNPDSIPLSQVQDVIRSGGFESLAQAKQWIAQPEILGPQIKRLLQTQKIARYALQSSPMVAESYLTLAELRFLEDITQPQQQTDPFIDQAILLNPISPYAHFLKGQRLISIGEEQQAFEHWQNCFQWSKEYQQTILSALSPVVAPEELLKLLNPNWQSLNQTLTFYEENRPVEEQKVVLKALLASSLEYWTTLNTQKRQELQFVMMIKLNNAKLTQELDLVAHQAIEEAPYNHHIRKLYAMSLYLQKRHAEAIEHLRWCLKVEHDQALEQALAQSEAQLLQIAAPQWEEGVRR